MRKKCLPLILACMVFAGFHSYIKAADLPESAGVNEQLQIRTITGTVKDQKTGELLIGATVILKGTSNATITDVEGRFSLTTDGKPNPVLLVSYIGYESREIAVGTSDTLIIELVDNTVLDDVVVVGYGSMKKSDLTGSISSISNEILVQGGNTNTAGAMQGTIPGVSIVRSNNKPGGGYSIKIRGVNSITASTDPLVVIDGLPGGNLDFLNPDDIEKIDILKDASATAIYGSSGANGVIIVTTKRGKLGKPQISYSGYAGFRKYMNLPDMMSGDEYVQMVREAVRATNNNVYKYDEQIFVDPSELQAVRDHNYFDWLDAVSGTAFTTNHSISATGGTESARYALSGGYMHEDGMISPQDYTRYNMRISLDLDVNKYFSFGGNLYMNHSIREKGNWDLLRDVFRMRPTQHPNSLVDGEEIWKYSSNNLFNPLVTVQNQQDNVKRLNLQGNIYAKITIDGFDFTSSFSPYFAQTQTGGYIGVWTKALQGTAKGATAEFNKESAMNWVWDNVANYKWSKDIHTIQVTGIFSSQKYQYDKLFAGTKDLSYNSLWYNLGGGEITGVTSSFNQWTMMSYALRLNYSLMDKYMLTASLRTDGSSRLADGHRWATFPSVALAWRISEESFLQNTDWLSNLKLRLSYGNAGNTNSVNPYSSTGNISGSVYYPFGNNNSIGNLPANLANPMLTWERTSEYNVGLDFGFIDNRIRGSVEYYNRTTNDLIMRRTVPVHLGYSSVTANIGSVRNQGVEVQVNTDNIRTKDFLWSTTITLGYNKNEIVSLADEEDLGTYSKNLEGMRGRYSDRWFVGEAVDINWNMETIGVWQLGEEEEAAKYGRKPGNFKLRDFNGDYALNNDDYFIDGKKTPHLTGGMTNSFYYRDFDLAFHMYFQQGAKAFNQFFTHFALEGNSQNFNNLRKDYWTPENPSNTMAQPSNMGAVGNISYEKTDFLKVAYVTLGYTLNKKILSTLKMNNIRVYGTVQNPLIFTKFSGLDPEQPSIGNIGETDAMTRNFIFGVNVTF